jgi:hypothetical protein
MTKYFIVFLWVSSALGASAQPKPTGSANINDPEAGAILEKAANRYKQMNGVDVDFTLTTIRPKLKPEDSDSKYTDNDQGRLYMKGTKFKITMNGYEVYCDGKNTWNYAAKTKEAQVNYYEETEETFSPAKIFTSYKEGYSYQIKEKKNYQGKNVTVIELSPTNRKVSYFKIDLAVDDQSSGIIEAKIYEKSGVRYIYKINKLSAAALNDDFFIFNTKNHPGVKLVDLR